MRAGGDLPAALDGHALARDRLLRHHERRELPLRAARRELAQLVRTGELLLEGTAPREAGGDGVRLGRDVVPVQRVADLEAQRVARAEAAGHKIGRASCRERVESSVGDVSIQEKAIEWAQR